MRSCAIAALVVAATAVEATPQTITGNDFEGTGDVDITGHACSDFDQGQTDQSIGWEIVMGQNADYYKPKAGYTMCEALKSNNLFLWSATRDGNFVAPSSYSGHSGGSAPYWPSDGRSYLPFWSNTAGTVNAGTNGCCHYTKTDASDWGRDFKIFKVTYSTPTTTTTTAAAPSPPASFFAADTPATCFINSAGRVIVHYTPELHPSFKCTRTSDTTCACSAKHPTHHKGGCRQFEVFGETREGGGGDCTDAGAYKGSCPHGQLLGGSTTDVHEHRTQDHHCGTCYAGYKLVNKACVACPANTYKIGHNDLATCAAQPMCPAGQKMSPDTSKTARRMCSSCGADTFTAGNNRDTSCTAWNTCTLDHPEEYETKAGTASSDRVCASHTTCAANQFETKPATITSNRECASRGSCENGSLVQAASATQANHCLTCNDGYKLVNKACDVQFPFTCVDTRQRGSRGWSYKGRTLSEATARSWCNGYKYMSLECPIGGAGFEVYCLNSYSDQIADRDCQGSPSVTYLNGASNGGCSGPYRFGNVWGGGWHRGALYKI